MPTIHVRYFAAVHNAAFLIDLNKLKTDFVGAIPQELKDAIWEAGNYANSFKAGGVLPAPATDYNALATDQARHLDAVPLFAVALSPVERAIAITHWLQARLQRLWLIELDTLAASKIADILNANRYLYDTVLLFALPEFFFTYLPDFGHSRRRIVPARNDPFAVGYLVTHPNEVINYSKPFYADALKVLFEGASENNTVPYRPMSLRTLGSKRINVIIMGGTIRWKEILAHHTTETIYNTLPIFSSQCGAPPHGPGPSLWTKVHTSWLDGSAGAGFASGRPIGPFKKQPNSADGPIDPPSGIQAVKLNTPEFIYNTPFRRHLKIGVDICLDHAMNGGLMKSKGINPHIQMLIAAGMQIHQASISTGAQVILRDDAGGLATGYSGKVEAAKVNYGWWRSLLSRNPGTSSVSGTIPTGSPWFTQFNFDITI